MSTGAPAKVPSGPHEVTPEGSGSFIVAVAARVHSASKRGAATVGAALLRFVSAVLDHQVADLIPA